MRLHWGDAVRALFAIRSPSVMGRESTAFSRGYDLGRSDAMQGQQIVDTVRRLRDGHE